MTDSPGPSLVEVLLRQREGWQRRQPLSVEQLLDLHPALRATPDAVLDLIYNEVVLREEQGQTPTLAEYLARFPDLAGPLRVQFEVEEALAEPGPSLGGSPGSSFAPSLPLTEPTFFPPELGETTPSVPGCEVLGELGRGGMGVVYRAWQPGPDRLVALKILRPGAPRARIRTEAQAAARLQHPHIVPIFEVKEFTTPFEGGSVERIALVLEYVAGGNLAQKIGGRPQPPRDAARLVELLARATAHAHARGVVHRDLKPSNVLLAGPPDAPLAACEPKIADFGLAKLEQAGPGLTHPSEVLGTPSYVAPEQADGQPVTPAVDVYSLGAILYELLTGRPPFLGASALDTLVQVRTQDPVPPRRLRPALPRDLEVITLTCLHRNPTRRYPGAQALADDLRAFLDGKPIAARPAGPVERLVKWARRRPAVASLGAASLAVLALALAAGVHFTGQVQQQRDLAERRADELRIQLSRTRKLLYTAQLLRAGALCEVDPLAALDLLDDPSGCPPDLRDFTWGVLHARCRRFRAVLVGHTRKVSVLAFRPDGGEVASGGHDGTVRLWDPLTGANRAAFHEHTARVTTLAYAPDGHTLASGSSDGAVKLWVDGALAGDLTRSLSRVAGLAFSPDGRTLAVHGAPPDGVRATSGGHAPGAVSLWDVATRQWKQTLPEPTEPGSSLAVGPGGLLACGGRTGIWVWDLQTGRLRHELRGHARPATALAFAVAGPGQWPLDPPLLLSGSSDQTVRLWDAATGAALATLDAENGVSALACAPGGATFATAGDTPLVPFGDDRPRPVVLWDARDRRPRESLCGHRTSVSALAFSPDGTLLATGGADRAIRLWDVARPADRLDLPGHCPGPASVAVSADGGTLAWVSRPDEGRGTEVTLWDLRRQQVRSRLRGHERPVRCLALSADGNTVASAAGGANEVELRIWDGATGGLLHALARHAGPVQALAFAPDCRTLASAGWEARVRLWDVATGREIRALPVPVTPISSLAFCPDGERLLAGGGQAGEAGAVTAWDVRAGRELAAWQAPDAVAGLAPGPGDGVVVAVRDGRIWLLDDGLRESLALATGVEGVSGLALHPDGRTLAIGGQGPAVHLWDLDVAQERATLPGHAGGLCLLAFAARGTLLLSAGASGPARFWHSAVPDRAAP